jgi:peptide/nickel transport system permease protein
LTDDPKKPDRPAPKPVAEVEIRHEKAGQSYGQLVWRQFVKKPHAVAGLVFVVFWFLVAIFAPFLASNRPLFYEEPGRPARCPLLEYLDFWDWVYLAGFVSFLAGLVTWAVLRRRRGVRHYSGRIGALATVGLMIAAVVACLFIFAAPRRDPGEKSKYRDAAAAGTATAVFPPIRYAADEIKSYLQFRTWNSRFDFEERTANIRQTYDNQRLALVQSTGGDNPLPFQAEMRRRGMQDIDDQEAADLGKERALVQSANAEMTTHYLGTDGQGRDVASRMIWGTRTSLAMGFVSVGIALVIGCTLGALCGYFGGKVDMVVMRFVEIIMCFPTFFLILTIVAFYGRSLIVFMVAFGITGWTGYTRFVRAEFLRLRELDYAVAARALGMGRTRIMFRHLLPNGMTPVLVSATIAVGSAVLTEGGISFLGLGDINAPSWGELINQARSSFQVAGWLVWFPGAAMFLTVLSYNLVGDGLRDALDPKLRV